MIDGALFGAVVFLLLLVLGFVLGLSTVTGGDEAKPLFAWLIALAWVALAVGQVAYFALMESSASQATLGKLALGLAVTDLEGRRIGLGRALGRTLAKLLSGLPLNLGYLMAAFTARKRALHDLVAGTLVVRRGQARLPMVVVAVLGGGLALLVVGGVVAAIAIPNYYRYQQRGKEVEAQTMLASLHAAELSHFAVAGEYRELELPAGIPGEARLAWAPDEKATAEAIGWSVTGTSYFTYRVAVGETEDGTQAFSTCAESDLDGDGSVAAWVTWEPVKLPSGKLVAPEPPCAFSPKLKRPLDYQEGDPVGVPVRVSPAEVH
jgi:uncharacterized RDD family membrane protein YckC/type II secretory pathway pseudopilin PulG